MNSPVTDVLLVDDSADDIEMMTRVLAGDGAARQIEALADGEQALDFLFCRNEYASRSFENPPRLVLLDLKMPKKNGLEILRAIKTDPRTQPIPVVLFSGSCEESDIIQVYRAHANGYVQKPVAFEEFCRTIRQLGAYWLSANQAPPQAAFRDSARVS